MRSELVGRDAELWHSHPELALALAVSIPVDTDSVRSARLAVQRLCHGAQSTVARSPSPPTILHLNDANVGFTDHFSAECVYVGAGRVAISLSSWSRPFPSEQSVELLRNYIRVRCDRHQWLARIGGKYLSVIATSPLRSVGHILFLKSGSPCLLALLLMIK